MVLDQYQLDKLGDGLMIKYTVLDNLKLGRFVFEALITITNRCTVPLSFDNWSIYFCQFHLIEPEPSDRQESVEIGNTGVSVSHINGGLFKLAPLECFQTVNTGETLEIPITAKHYSVARCDCLPNWFIVADGLRPCLIKSTVGEHLNFVQPFEKPCQWKRFDYVLDNGKKRTDLYDPYTPDVRFEKHYVEDLQEAGNLILPSPLNIYKEESFIKVSYKNWKIVTESAFRQEAQYMSAKSKIPIASESSTLMNCIVLKQNKDLKINNESIINSYEAYSLHVSKTDNNIVLEARDNPGIFYAIQSLLSLLYKNDSTSIPCVSIEDSPRYAYRGMHLDVSRNFHSKNDILRLLDLMSIYKLNKFHFHLTDDEGWRLEIPDLPELVEVGAHRGHSDGDHPCILPVLGSGPFPVGSGSGYYTVNEYKEILTYAAARHIKVIPEIDMPGHSHAAIMAMRARYNRLVNAKQKTAAEEYLLSDLNDRCVSKSVQMFVENSLNPGLESTFTFIKKVVQEVKTMHADINPLQIFHFGGDEVPYKAWKTSPACNALVSSGIVDSFSDLMEYFVRRVASIVAQSDLALGAWQDGIIDDTEPYPRSRFPNSEVYVHAWKNMWGSKHADDTVKLAKNGYKVIMAQGTHLYFDHPYEPDPEERGLYWACRFCDTRKVFNFMPENVFANADVKITGEIISPGERQTMDVDKDKESLENIIGIQGQLWTELVRTSDQLGEMIFPRLLSLAERAWHKASWEDMNDEVDRQVEQDKDWQLFSNSLGYKELERIGESTMTYYIPPPGARWISLLEFEALCAYPGLKIQYKTENSLWKDYTQTVLIPDLTDIQLRTVSCDGKRYSRVVVLKCDVEK